MILYNSYATWKAIEGGIMSNRHMATKRAHNKTRPADVQRRRRAFSMLEQDAGRKKASERRKAAATQLPPTSSIPIADYNNWTPEEVPVVQSSQVIEDAPPDSFESPESSNIHSARYDHFTEQLWVVFRREVDGGECPTYLYTGFPPAMWVEFVQATSKGRFVAQRIKPMFAGKRV